MLETGRVPIHIYAEKQCIKNWRLIAKAKCAKGLTLLFYEIAIKANLKLPNLTETEH